MTILTVVSNAKFEAVNSVSPEGPETIKAWIQPILDQPGGQGGEFDVEPVQEQALWAIRSPEGNVSFVDPGYFLRAFDIIEGDDDDEATKFEKMLGDAPTAEK